MVAGVTFVTPAAAEAEELEVVEVGELAAVVDGGVRIVSTHITNSHRFLFCLPAGDHGTVYPHQCRHLSLRQPLRRLSVGVLVLLALELLTRLDSASHWLTA